MHLQDLVDPSLANARCLRNESYKVTFEDYDGVRRDGLIVYHGDYPVLCHNVRQLNGYPIRDRRGFTYSWMMDEGFPERKNMKLNLIQNEFAF